MNKKERIGIVTACMNRSEALSVSLQSWLIQGSIDEIIIVDWCSKQSLKPLEAIDPRIKVHTHVGEKYFNISRAFNLGFAQSTCDRVLKMDVDYVLNPYENISELELPERSFLTGDWEDVEIDKPGFLRYLNGFIYIRKKDFDQVNGYNEKFVGYGEDDSELYRVLVESGMEHNKLQLQFAGKPDWPVLSSPLYVFHIPHPEKNRTENYKTEDHTKSHDKNISRSRI